MNEPQDRRESERSSSPLGRIDGAEASTPRLCLVLHAHLPFVRHPEHPRFLEEDWLYEAILEVYLPLLLRFERLAEESIATPCTLSLSSTLLAMFEDAALSDRFTAWLEQRIEFLRAETWRLRWLPQAQGLAAQYLAESEAARDLYVTRYRRDLISAFARLENGIELTTTNATHGFLPLLGDAAPLWRAQIATARGEHRRYFGREPSGHWLSECGYAAGLDRVLAECGIASCVLEEHGVLHARPSPRHGAHAPVQSEAGVLFFARDAAASREIWSLREGLPGHPLYRDFYRDVGWDLDLEYLARYLHDPARRNPLAVRYHRVTGAGEKELYDREVGLALAERHAQDFWARRESQAEELASRLGRPPVITLPFDAELFGHWWYEGPHFLETLFREASRSNRLHLVGLSEARSLERRVQRADPAPSSWGEGGYSAYWLNRENDWILRRLRRAGEATVAIASRWSLGIPELAGGERQLRQLCRELLLAQSSDWPFILKSGASAEYAARRAGEHLDACDRLYDGLVKGRVDMSYLRERELRWPIFPNLDWRVFADAKGAPA